MSCGRRKGKPERVLNILLRACECVRVGSMQKVRTKTGKQEVFHKRERQKKGKKYRYGWKKHGRRHPQNVKDFRWKSGWRGKNTARACTRPAEKMLREPKNTGMTNKKTASSIRKTQKIPEKNRDDGEKTRRAPAQNRQKKWFGNRKIPE